MAASASKQVQFTTKAQVEMAPEAPSEQIQITGYEVRTIWLVRELDRTSRWWLWALPVWTVLLFLSTLTHQPDPRTEFASFAGYVTTNTFLVSHIVASIVGAAVGVLGLLALFIFLALRIRSRVASVGLVLAVLGNVMITAVFGVAAFGQSAVGRLYYSGETESAVAIYNDMYGGPLTATVSTGLLLLVAGVVSLGIAIARSRVLPVWTGIGLALGIVVFAVVGVILADVVQSIGALVLVASTVWLAYKAGRAPVLLQNTE